MPELSVVVPVYGVQDYLDTCVESLLGQDFKDIEVILVDDGSPDNCGEMCDAWAKKDSRVVALHKENGGVSSARNMGIEKARGKYLAFVDPDDYVSKEIYTEPLERMRAGAYDLVLFGMTLYRTNGEIDRWIPPKIETNSIQQLAPYMSGHKGLPIILQVILNKIYRMDIINGQSIRFDARQRFYECDQFNYAYFTHVQRITTVQDCHYQCVRRPGSLTNTTTHDYYALLMENAKYIEAFFDAVGGFDEVRPQWLKERKIRGLLNQYHYLLDKNGLDFAYRKSGFYELAGDTEKRGLILENAPTNTWGLRAGRFCIKYRLPGLLAAIVSLRNTLKK